MEKQSSDFMQFTVRGCQIVILSVTVILWYIW